MKIFVQSDQEMLDIWADEDINHVEQILGIEFPFADGTYQSEIDFDKTPDFDETQPVDRTKFRRGPDCRMPESYPCCVVRFHEDTYDRMGSIVIDLFEVVYPEDVQSLEPKEPALESFEELPWDEEDARLAGAPLPRKG